MPTCPKCQKYYKKKGNLRNHIKTAHPEVVEVKPPMKMPSPTESIGTDEKIDLSKEPNLSGSERSTSGWDVEFKEFDEWLSSVEPQAREGEEMLQQQKQMLLVSIEQIKDMYIIVNTILDALVEALGGDTPCYTAMAQETLDSIANSTKMTLDAYNVQVSPLTALFITISLAYSRPTLQAIKSISSNRKKRRQQKDRQKSGEQQFIADTATSQSEMS